MQSIPRPRLQQGHIEPSNSGPRHSALRVRQGGPVSRVVSEECTGGPGNFAGGRQCCEEGDRQEDLFGEIIHTIYTNIINGKEMFLLRFYLLRLERFTLVDL